MKTLMVLFVKFVDRPLQTAPHSTQEEFGLQNLFAIGRKLLRKSKLVREVTCILELVKPASNVTRKFSRTITPKDGHARKGEE